MESEHNNRSRIIGLRLTSKEYKQIEQKWKASKCRKLSEYARHKLLDEPHLVAYRNQSLDDIMTEAMRLRAELNSVGNNFNQVVKKLHTLQQIPEFRVWIIAYEAERKILFSKIDDIKNLIQKIAEKWLQ